MAKMRGKSKAKKEEENPHVHKDLKGLNMTINEFGEIVSNISIDKLNAFLDREVPDKKLPHREDEPLITESTEEEDDSWLTTDEEDEIPKVEK